MTNRQQTLNLTATSSKAKKRKHANHSSVENTPPSGSGSKSPRMTSPSKSPAANKKMAATKAAVPSKITPQASAKYAPKPGSGSVTPPASAKYVPKPSSGSPLTKSKRAFPSSKPKKYFPMPAPTPSSTQAAGSAKKPVPKRRVRRVNAVKSHTSVQTSPGLLNNK